MWCSYLILLLLLFSQVRIHSFLEKTKNSLVRTRGTGPQLHAHIGGRTRRRRPNLWPYGWSILVIGLDIKQARTFID